MPVTKGIACGNFWDFKKNEKWGTQGEIDSRKLTGKNLILLGHFEREP